MTTEAEKYAQRGVSASKFEIHDAIKTLDKGLFPNAFCKILPDFTNGDADFCNIMHADTAGTKTSLAYLYWRETGDLGVWKGIVQDAIVMNLDDMACVGCVDNIVLSSTIGRNRHKISADVIKTLIEATTTFVEQMAEYGINIHLSGGETADVGDIVRTIDVGYTAFARMRRKDVIENAIRPKDVIVGFASFGQSSYETYYNGGMGSNGLTSARHDVLSKYYCEKYPESYDHASPESVIYTGSKKVTDFIEIHGVLMPVGKVLLSPTRTYLPLLKQILDSVDRSKLHGIIHNTGGGQTKVLKFAPNVHIVKDHLFELPPLFELIQTQSRTEWQEMYQVFNMGHRLEIYTDEDTAERLISMAQKFNIEAKVIGHVTKPLTANNSSLTVKSPYGTFEYA
jgi:phosphoribosylformylglycinamidine cyclo-ligase